jgi:hypothetical protein
MSDWKKITVADVEMLRVNYQQRITESYLDDYKHMNVMWWRGPRFPICPIPPRNKTELIGDTGANDAS